MRNRLNYRENKVKEKLVGEISFSEVYCGEGYTVIFNEPIIYNCLLRVERNYFRDGSGPYFRGDRYIYLKGFEEEREWGSLVNSFSTNVNFDDYSPYGVIVSDINVYVLDTYGWFSNGTMNKLDYRNHFVSKIEDIYWEPKPSVTLQRHREINSNRIYLEIND